MVFPEEIARLIGAGIDEQKRALKVVHDLFVGKVLQVIEQLLIEVGCFIGVAARMQQNECFPNFGVPGLAGVNALNQQNAAGNQQQHNYQHDAVLPNEGHNVLDERLEEQE